MAGGPGARGRAPGRLPLGPDRRRLERQDPGAEARPITPEPATRAGLRYADATLDPDGSWLVCVRESHDAGEVRNELVVLPADGSAPPRVLATGRDFYAAPRLDGRGERLAWLEWDHPRMPWDGTELRLAAFDRSGGELGGEPRLIAGGPEESVVEPRWSPDGALHFISDAGGWWNLYRAGDGGIVEPVRPMEAEFSTAQWVLGMSSYTFLPDGAIVCAHGRGPVWRLGVIGPRREPGGTVASIRALDLPFTTFSPPSLRTTADGKVAAFAGGPTSSAALVVVDPASSCFEVLRRSREPVVDPAYLSVPSLVEFPTEEGTAHALYYPPANPDARAPDGELPPLIVVSHGGPTAQVVDQLSLTVQYFTSRGFAVVDVDYGGSTGYGRAYRRRLHDPVRAHLPRPVRRRGELLRRRRRRGAGQGYAQVRVALPRPVDRSQSRAAEVYRERSPIHHIERLSCPVVLLQGLEDPVVPPRRPRPS